MTERRDAVTVQEVIDQLSECNPDLPVFVCGYERGLRDYSGLQVVKAEIMNQSPGNDHELLEVDQEGDPDYEHEVGILIIGHFSA